ncbi:MAG: DNA polymerase I [Rhodospirillales bacterium]|nr:DNA polymerase I [Rhodospirillales bacterium]
MTEATETKPDNHLYLIDGSGYIFRAYHALPPLTRTDGTPIGAVTGFCNMLFKMLDDSHGDDGVTHLAVIFDTARKTFRSDIYPAYKAHRPPPPEDLIPQFALIREAVKAFNVPSVEMAGYEADDLIATYARLATEAGWDVTIVSSDKDLMQLVGPKVRMLDPMKTRIIGPEEVREKFGVGPERVIDVQALAGDSSDNVPGVPGIGVKTAAELINTYGDLDGLLAHADEIKQPKRREKLIENADLARISRQLVTLVDDVPLVNGEHEVLSEMTLHPPAPDKLITYLDQQELRALRAKVLARWGGAGGTAPSGQASPGATAHGGHVGAAAMAVPDPTAELAGLEGAYTTVTTLDELDNWIARAEAVGTVAVDTETTSLDTLQADLVGISLCVEPGAACYIPLGHRGGVEQGAFDLGDGDGGAGTGDGGLLPGQIGLKDALARLNPMLEHPGILKVQQNAKYDMKIFAQVGNGSAINLGPVDDTMLLSYALEGGMHGHGLDELCRLHFGHENMSFKDVAGTGKAQVTFDQVPIEKASDYAAEDADMALRLHRLLKPRLAAEHMATVYETLERPLVPVLAAMERAGIKVDRAVLAELSTDFAGRMATLEAEIHTLAGHPFNVGSPKQLGEVLFDEMSLPGGKKGKAGAYATGVEVLEDLAAQGHDLPARVMDWRQLAKLKNTYTDSLQAQINPNTGRVHTSYSMAATSTGRLASTDPNLQNIPVRTEEGRKIRRAFVAEGGTTLMSADYSQIELRLLAHIAGIDTLRQAFADGLDIHAMTASEIFGVPIEGMDPMVRRRAKAINFGIIYGISAFGLARQLGISRGEAAEFIETYFARFPGIRAYMDDTIEQCRKQGFVETLFGRRCHIPGINDKNGARKSFSERAAINAPIQGSAADVIRRAMVRMPGALTGAKLGAKMLLQVHDELVFEVPDAELEATTALVKDIMENAAAPARNISVPLTVDVGTGANWDDAH